MKWIIIINHIHYCTVDTKDVENAKTIYGNDAPYLKGKTTRKKPILVTEDITRVPKEFLKLNKDIFLTMDIFFVNKIKFLITLRRNIYFTATSNSPTQKARDTLKPPLHIYVFY